MRRRDVLLAALASTLPLPSTAQKKIARVGMLSTGSLASSPHIYEGFKARMRELGWVEGRTIEYLIVSADGYVDRLDGFARKLVSDKVDVIVAGPPNSAVAARKATSTIPIVMGNVPDPVALGLVSSLSRPGGNVTGVSSQTTALAAKELELLKAVIPGLKRVGLLYSEKNPNASAFRKTVEQAAAALSLSIIASVANTPDEFGAAIARLAAAGVQAVAVPADPMILGERRALNDLLAKARLPAAFGNRDHAEDGALLSYAPDIVENFRLAADFVDRILKGADPAKLPVQQSDRIELVVNLKTARTLGLAIPQSVLLRADRVIE